MRKWVLMVFCLMLLLMPVTSAATELGLTSYPDGIENFVCGAFPPPGMYYQNYWLFYTADRFPGGPPNPKAFLFAQVFRFIYSSRVQILGANWGTHLVLPLVYTDLKSTFQGITVADDQRFGLANSAFDPIILGWHFGDFHVTAAFEIQFPGTYDRLQPASPSRNYFTFQPILAFAYMPSWGLGINIKMMYDFPTRNNRPLAITGARNTYQSGQSFHFDYCVDYAVLPSLRVGAAGYYYTQTTSDVADGIDIGFHGRSFALGPAIKYDWQRWTFAAISQFEMATKNRPEGIRNWIRIWYAF
ncbi:MAG: SphA family protein [Desulfobacca sp.]|uniref:SphA family protein n=1 Tax=Desulfobacca sp. TaxID=2067990 RepID=UPI0040496CF9